MRTPRLYWPAPLPTGTVPLPDAAARHLLKVLRRRDGDPVELFDGAGSVAEAILCDVSPKGGQLTVGDAREDRRSEPLQTRQSNLSSLSVNSFTTRLM